VPYTPLTRRQGGRLARLIVVGMLLQGCVVGYVFYQSYVGRESVVDASRLGCERSKLDRKDNADFQWAQARYILKVSGAASVKADVKRAARTALKTFNRTSKSLERRARIDCKKAFPKAGLLP
jgi:hypothetical protein